MKIDKNYLSHLTSQRELIAESASAYTAAAANLPKLRESHETLSKLVDDLQSSVAWDDDSAVMRLILKREQLALLHVELENRQASIEPQERELRVRIAGLSDIIQHLVEPELQSLIADTAKQLKDVYPDPDLARHYAGQSSKVQHFLNTLMRRNYGQVKSDVEQ
jgi:hypothetical protein